MTDTDEAVERLSRAMSAVIGAGYVIVSNAEYQRLAEGGGGEVERLTRENERLRDAAGWLDLYAENERLRAALRQIADLDDLPDWTDARNIALAALHADKEPTASEAHEWKSYDLAVLNATNLSPGACRICGVHVLNHHPLHADKEGEHGKYCSECGGGRDFGGQMVHRLGCKGVDWSLDDLAAADGGEVERAARLLRVWKENCADAVVRFQRAEAMLADLAEAAQAMADGCWEGTGGDRDYNDARLRDLQDRLAALHADKEGE